IEPHTTDKGSHTASARDRWVDTKPDVGPVLTRDVLLATCREHRANGARACSLTNPGLAERRRPTSTPQRTVTDSRLWTIPRRHGGRLLSLAQAGRGRGRAPGVDDQQEQARRGG